MGESGRKRTEVGEGFAGAFFWAAFLGVASEPEGEGAWLVGVEAGGEGWVGESSAGLFGAGGGGGMGGGVGLLRSGVGGGGGRWGGLESAAALA
jgi:hypothetical protein